jgi:hypothetical protein
MEGCDGPAQHNTVTLVGNTVRMEKCHPSELILRIV